MRLYSVARLCPDLGSHSFTGCWLSLLPDAISALVGCQSTPFTSAPCPRRIRSSWHRRKSQRRTVPSSEQVANLVSVGQKLAKERKEEGSELVLIESQLGRSFKYVATLSVYSTLARLPLNQFNKFINYLFLAIDIRDVRSQRFKARINFY